MKTDTVERTLTENIIKKVALRFMRQYYKFRLRFDDQPVIAKYDLEGVGGIVADGYYSFKKTDGKPFIATFEATANDSRDEVLYKPQRSILIWDGLAVGSLVALVFTLANFFQNYHQLEEREVMFRLVVLGIVVLASAALFYVVAQNFRRYRYIYAIEQFKRYHADEQWIALAGNVFENSNDKYFRELRDQCVVNGFGLLKIDADLDPKILVTPSRQDIFQGKRKAVPFLPQETSTQLQLRNEFGLIAGLKNYLPAFLKKDKSIYRFRRTFYNQMFVMAGCVFLTVFLMKKEMQLAAFQEVDAKKFRDEISIPPSNTGPEQKEYLGNAPQTSQANKLEIEEFNNSLWQPKKEQPKAQTQEKAATPAPKKRVDTTEIYINPSTEQAIAYDCTRFYNFESKKYIIEEGIYTSWPAAKKRLDLLRKSNIESAALLLACFSQNEEGYVIYVGMIYNSPEEASQKIDSLRGTPKSVLRNVEGMRIRTLFPKLQ